VSRRSGNSFSSDVIKRFLQALIENGPLGKTRLSGKAGINYEMCIKYVSFLMMLNWVEIIELDNGAQRVSVTSEGIEHLRKLQGESSREGFDDEGKSDISLPSLKESSTQIKSGYQHPHRGKQKNIVIVDDDESSLTMYESFLEHGGSSSSSFKVKTFSRPDQALRYLVDHPNSYDLVVLDIRMPKMSGLRLFQGLKAANPHAKVIFLSSLDAGPELLEIFPDIKPNQFIRKPVDRNKLIRIISEAIS
jgi:CheY-like chemotaxis protein/predicted transcriptional regulator